MGLNPSTCHLAGQQALAAPVFLCFHLPASGFLRPPRILGSAWSPGADSRQRPELLSFILALPCSSLFTSVFPSLGLHSPSLVQVDSKLVAFYGSGSLGTQV